MLKLERWHLAWHILTGFFGSRSDADRVGMGMARLSRTNPPPRDSRQVCPGGCGELTRGCASIGQTKVAGALVVDPIDLTKHQTVHFYGIATLYSIQGH